MLRPERLDVDVRRGYVEVAQEDRVVEGLGPNVDEEVVDADREDDLEQAMSMTTARTMKLAKSVSVVDARQNREVDMDLVEKEDVKEVGKAMVMGRCGGVMSLVTMGRGPRGIRALLPCQMVLGFHLKGVPSWG